MKKLIILLGVLGGSFSAICVRLSNAPSMVLVFYRVAMAALLLCPYVFWKARGELKLLSRKEWLLCALSGLFLGLHFALYFESLKYTGISSSVVLVNTEVFFVAFALLFLFREKISVMGWVGILATFAGSIVIAMADAGGGSNVLLGDGMAFLGAAAMAVYTLLGKVCRKRISTTVYTFIVYTAAAATVLIMLCIGGTPVFGYEPVNYLTALGMAVFSTLLGHSIFSWGLKYESASYISTVKLMEPVFASVLGLLIFGEIPDLIVVIGGCIVILGVYLYAGFAEKK